MCIYTTLIYGLLGIAGLALVSAVAEWIMRLRDDRMYVDAEPVEDDRDWQAEFQRIVSGRVK